MTGDWDLAWRALHAWSCDVFITELTTAVVAGPRRHEEVCEEQVDDAEDMSFWSWAGGGKDEYSDELLIVGVGDKRPELDEAA